MIKVEITRFKKDNYEKIIKVRVHSHGDPIVCSAVSALVINTVNSLEILTSEKFACEYEEDGGYLELSILGSNDEKNDDGQLLLNSLSIGLHGISKEYKNEIHIIEQEV